MSENSKNYIVFHENDSKLETTKKHLDKDSAIHEARRLALQDKYSNFYVYELVTVVIPKTEIVLNNLKPIEL